MSQKQTPHPEIIEHVPLNGPDSSPGAKKSGSFFRTRYQNEMSFRSESLFRRMARLPLPSLVSISDCSGIIGPPEAGRLRR
jgi:hypothetical protein